MNAKVLSFRKGKPAVPPNCWRFEDGFTGVPVREIRGALLRPFNDGRTSVGVNFLVPSGYFGQTLETLALPSDPEPFERIVGVPAKPYVSLTFTYYFGSP